MTSAGEQLLAAYDRLGFDTQPARQALLAWQEEDRPEQKPKKRRSFELRLEELLTAVHQETAKIVAVGFLDLNDVALMAGQRHQNRIFRQLAMLHIARDLAHGNEVRGSAVEEASAHRWAAAHAAVLRGEASRLRAADPAAP